MTSILYLLTSSLPATTFLSLENKVLDHTKGLNIVHLNLFELKSLTSVDNYLIFSLKNSNLDCCYTLIYTLLHNI